MKAIARITLLLLALLTCFSFVACADVEKTGAWETATYDRNTELGEGAKTVTVKVIADEQDLIFTIHTDKETVGEALLEIGIVEGTMGDYGLYITHVNGIPAIYEEDATYWAFYINGEYAMTVVDQTPIAQGETYTLKVEK